jgi:hypothetical protein
MASMKHKQFLFSKDNLESLEKMDLDVSFCDSDGK